jgi:hypothetical protein
VFHHILSVLPVSFLAEFILVATPPPLKTFHVDPNHFGCMQLLSGLRLLNMDPDKDVLPLVLAVPLHPAMGLGLLLSPPLQPQELELLLSPPWCWECCLFEILPSPLDAFMMPHLTLSGAF